MPAAPPMTPRCGRITAPSPWIGTGRSIPPYSCASRMNAAAEEIRRRIADDQRINLQAIPQKKYFADQASTSIGIKLLGNFIAVLMGIGACFAAMNMMYGSVMSRSREIATLRAIGFRRRNILASFLFESVLLGLMGGILGCRPGSADPWHFGGHGEFRNLQRGALSLQAYAGNPPAGTDVCRRRRASSVGIFRRGAPPGSGLSRFSGINRARGMRAMAEPLIEMNGSQQDLQAGQRGNSGVARYQPQGV